MENEIEANHANSLNENNEEALPHSKKPEEENSGIQDYTIRKARKNLRAGYANAVQEVQAARHYTLEIIKTHPLTTMAAAFMIGAIISAGASFWTKSR